MAYSTVNVLPPWKMLALATQFWHKRSQGDMAMVMREMHEPPGAKLAGATDLGAEANADDDAPVPLANTQAPPLLSEAPAQISVLAIAALVISIFGIFILPAILGIGLALAALRAIKRDSSRLRGRELALIALSLSIVLLIHSLVIIGVVWGTISLAQGVADIIMGQINDFFSWIASWFN